MERKEPAVRELFIEELAEVTGGGNPLDKLGIWQWLQEQLVTTMACGEEAPNTC